MKLLSSTFTDKKRDLGDTHDALKGINNGSNN